MGNYIELKTNYRLICDYCIPPHCLHIGTLWYSDA
jgi:hypothetical protein